MSKFATSLLERLNYNTEMVSAENAIENMKKINPRFNENDIFTLAYLSTNPEISENDREIFKQCLKTIAKREQEQYEKLKQQINIRTVDNAVDNTQKSRNILYDI